MKKKFLLLMLTLVCAACLVLGVSGCGLLDGGGDDDTDQNEQVDSDFGFELSSDGNGYIVYDNGCSGDVIIPSTYNNLPVVGIAENAFSYSGYGSNTSVTSITIPDSVTTIGRAAFAGCSNLRSVNIPSGITKIEDYTFSCCYALKSIIIPDGVTSIGECAFNECTSLESITLPEGLKTIGTYAFEVCVTLDSITIPDSVESIEDFAFYRSGIRNVTGTAYAIGCMGWIYDQIESVTVTSGEISENAFIYFDMLTSVTLNEGVTGIQDEAFYGRNLVKSIVIPDSVTFIGESAFENCGIKSLTIGAGVTTIGSSAFSSCTHLTELNFNATAMEDLEADNKVFYNAGRYADGITVNIGANVTKIPAYLFYAYSSQIFNDCPNVTSVVFEENSKCESIGDYAFAYCTKLAQITNMPLATFNENIVEESTLITVSDLAVTYDNGKYLGGALIGIVDSSVEYFIVKDGTTSIDANVFSECTALRFVYIPESVTKIGSNALKFASVSNNCTTVIFFEASSGRGSTSTTYTNWLGTYSSGTRLASQYYTCVGSAKLADEYIYTVSSDEAVIYAYYGTDTAITVPSTIDGYTVSGVNGYAYAELDITSVTFPSTCDTLGGDVPNMTSTAFMPFGWCDELTAVTFSAMSVDIEAYSFYNCTALTNVNFGSAQMASIMNNAFDGCTALTSITLPSMLMLGQSIFNGCTALTSVTAGSETSVTITYYMTTSGSVNYNASIVINNGADLATALKETYATTYILFYINIDMSAYADMGM